MKKISSNAVICNPVAKVVRNNNIIRRLLGVVVLAVFAFSVTPKILLHNLVADHKDTPRQHNKSNEQQLSKTGFNCNCDNLVVESPFVNDCASIDLKATQKFPEQQVVYTNGFPSLHYFYFELRGPPAIMLTDFS